MSRPTTRTRRTSRRDTRRTTNNGAPLDLRVGSFVVVPKGTPVWAPFNHTWVPHRFAGYSEPHPARIFGFVRASTGTRSRAPRPRLAVVRLHDMVTDETRAVPVDALVLTDTDGMLNGRCQVCGGSDRQYAEDACTCLHCAECGANHGREGVGLSIASSDALARLLGDDGCCGECWTARKARALANHPHTKDADCTLDDRDTCVLCDVHHAEPCYDCGQRGYHATTCPALAADRAANRAVSHEDNEDDGCP